MKHWILNMVTALTVLSTICNSDRLYVHGVFHLTTGYKDGNGQCGDNDESGDGYKPLLWNGFYHMEFIGLAGEEK